MASRIIEIAKDFAVAPGPRYERHGPNSGELFRKQVLVPALKSALGAHSVVDVKLDGAAGYGGSFLEEAFGGLVRLEGFTREQLGKALRIVVVSPAYKPYKDMALRYIAEAQPGVNVSA